MTLGEAFTIRLKLLLIKHDNSLYKFAKDNCIARSTLVNIIEGRTKCPTLAIIYQVAVGFNMTPIEFLSFPEFTNLDELDYL